MKNMKLAISVSLIFCLIIVLAACGSGNGNKQQTQGAATAPATKDTKAEPTKKDDFPNKPITLIVPFSAGGGFDSLGRQIAKSMSKTLGVPVNVKNVAGAGQRLGSTEFQKSDGDGYTLLFPDDSGLYSASLIEGKQEYDVTSWKWIGGIREGIGAFIVPKDSPYKTIEDLYNSKKKIRLADIGLGGGFFAPHVVLIESWKKDNFSFVTGYKGNADIVPGLMRGEADAYYNVVVSSVMKFVQSGDLRILAIVNDERVDYLKDVPTMKEFPNIPSSELKAISTYYGIAAPPKTAPHRIAVLQDALKKAAEDPELLVWADKAGFKDDIAFTTSEEYTKIKEAQLKTYDAFTQPLKDWAAKLSK